MSSNSLSIARAANEFANTEFGKHYIQRLKGLRKDLLKKSMDRNLTDYQKSSYASEAYSYNSEIEYFEIAHSIISNPDIISKLRSKLKDKEFNDII